MRTRVFAIAVAMLVIIVFACSCSSRTDMPRLPALIINGKKDGSPDEARYESAVKVCENLGFACQRTPAMFVNMDVYKEACGDHSDKDKEERYVRGCMFAHKVAMEKIAKSQERHIVFEDDIRITDKYNVKGQLSKFLHDTESNDIAYLGHCYGGMCTHALAITPEGAQKALQLVDWCDGSVPVDVQLKKLCDDGKLNCSYAPPVSWWHTERAEKVLKFFGFKRDSWTDGLVWQKEEDEGTVKDQAWF